MAVVDNRVTMHLAEFITSSHPPVEALRRAAIAVCDTVGVILAGVAEPASNILRRTITGECRGPCHLLGTADRTSAAEAALANGVAAHAHDYDDMCFVSMAHPSCALVPAALAAADSSDAPGRTVLNGYIVGFELECRLGSVMNPQHYHTRGWHCTSSIGTLGAAAAAARLLGLRHEQIAHALGIAASLACGLKENIGTMTKPLHAGIAARNGVVSALLARSGFTSSEDALTGLQGYLAAMDSGGSAADFAR